MKSKTYSVYSRPILKLLVCGLCLAASLWSQQNKLIVSPPDAVTVKRGHSIVAPVKIATLPGFHVNSDKPKDEYLIPLSLTWRTGPLQPKSVMYPHPEVMKVGADSLSVFTGSFEVNTDFAAPATAPEGSSVMVGKLHYQACNNQMCFRPTTVEVRLPVTIE